MHKLFSKNIQKTLHFGIFISQNGASFLYSLKLISLIGIHLASVIHGYHVVTTVYIDNATFRLAISYQNRIADTKFFRLLSAKQTEKGKDPNDLKEQSKGKANQSNK